ncbi:conserved hypothetical protein [Virus Rctr85]|nr:conserved hypothetical protein [Virus Rctr85]
MADKERDFTAKMRRAKLIYLQNPDGVTDIELAEMLDVGRATAFRLHKALGAKQVSRGYYTLVPTKEDIHEAMLILRRAGLMAS